MNTTTQPTHSPELPDQYKRHRAQADQIVKNLIAQNEKELARWGKPNADAKLIDVAGGFLTNDGRSLKRNWDLIEALKQDERLAVTHAPGTHYADVRVHLLKFKLKPDPMSTQAKHTPGPWKVMPCPISAGKHPFHDSRWIATEDASVEFGHDPRSWTLQSGSLICEMRDGPEANAQLIASAPDLLAAIKQFTLRFEALEEKESKGHMLYWREITSNGAYDAAKRAIHLATGGNAQ